MNLSQSPVSAKALNIKTDLSLKEMISYLDNRLDELKKMVESEAWFGERQQIAQRIDELERAKKWLINNFRQ